MASWAAGELLLMQRRKPGAARRSRSEISDAKHVDDYQVAATSGRCSHEKFTMPIRQAVRAIQATLIFTGDLDANYRATLLGFATYGLALAQGLSNLLYFAAAV